MTQRSDACLRACEGIPTEILVAMPPGKLLYILNDDAKEKMAREVLANETMTVLKRYREERK